MLTIDFITKGMQYSIPNSWDGLTPYHFQALMRDIQRFAEGKISVGMVRVNYVCRIMGWNLQKIRNTDGWANVAWLAEQVTFPFTIVYPDNDAALQELDSETYRLCKKIPPHRLHGITISRYLDRLDYKYAVDSCFCKQLVPAIHLEDETFFAYNTLIPQHFDLTLFIST